MEHHTPKKNKVGWQRNEAQPLRGSSGGILNINVQEMINLSGTLMR
jgi:hypothetical protein